MGYLNDEGITRVPKHVRDAAVRTNIVTIQAAVTTAIADLAAVKAETDLRVTGGVGLDNTQTIALDALVETAVLSVAAISTAITASGL